jgi:uncharacterized protein
VMAEALVRQVDGFYRFIQVASLESGQFLDYSKLAKRAKISRQSVTRHFEILEDTLIATRLENDPELDPEEADLIKHPRYFFFDLGVLNALRGSFELNSERIGMLFEHLVMNQISNTATANGWDYSFHNFRTRGGLEVDFILKLNGTLFAIECNSSEQVTHTDLNPLRELSRYYPKIEKRVFYRGTKELKDGDIWILPFETGIRSFGKGRNNL